MAREWFVFNLKPEQEGRTPYSKDNLLALHGQIEEWLAANKRKSVKLQLLSQKSGDGVTTWEKLDDRWPAATLRVKVRSHRDAVLFKMFFSDYLFTPYTPKVTDYSNVILPLIRRVMPSVIANQLIGVQPMSGPVGLIHALKVRYATSPPPPPKSTPKLFQKEWEKAKEQLIKSVRKGL